MPGEGSYNTADLLRRHRRKARLEQDRGRGGILDPRRQERVTDPKAFEDFFKRADTYKHVVSRLQELASRRYRQGQDRQRQRNVQENYGRRADGRDRLTHRSQIGLSPEGSPRNLNARLRGGSGAAGTSRPSLGSIVNTGMADLTPDNMLEHLRPIEEQDAMANRAIAGTPGGRSGIGHRRLRELANMLRHARTSRRGERWVKED